MPHFEEMINDTEKNVISGGTLYLVATPIGNLSDLSARAIKVLREVDVIAAEDTRNTQKLLSILEIQGKELISYYEHNKRAKGEILAEKLEEGLSVALVTDAGTPAISDPGEDLVRLCAERGIPVTSVPGCCAAVNALALSALKTGRFAFEGFLSTNAGERRERLSEIAREKRTLIFYEAPHKLSKTLADLFATFGNRRITLCREMTKRNEEIIRTTLKEAITLYESISPRGEYVLVLEGEDALPEDMRPKEEAWYSSLTHEEHVNAYEAKGLSRMDAIKAAAKDLGVAKSVLYKELQTN